MRNPSDPGIRDLLDRVPRWRGCQDLATEPLAGGQSNRAWLVTANGERFVLRSRSRVWDGPDARAELDAHRTASAAGLAPEVIYANPAAGVLVTRFIAGTGFGRRALLEPGGLTRLAGLLGALHSLPVPVTRFRPIAAADAYWARYRAQTSPDPATARMRAGFVAEGLALAAQLSLTRFCHHDLIGGNIIDSGGRLIALDFEYAAAGDRRMELAFVASAEDLDEAQTGRLAAACGFDPVGQRPALRDLRRLADYLGAHWYLACASTADDRGLRERAASLVARLTSG